MKGPLKDSTVWRRFSAVNDDDGGQVDSIVQLYLNLPKLKVRQVVARWHRAVGGRTGGAGTTTPKPEQFDRPRCSLTLFSSLSAGVKAFLLVWIDSKSRISILLRCRSSNIQGQHLHCSGKNARHFQNTLIKSYLGIFTH